MNNTMNYMFIKLDKGFNTHLVRRCDLQELSLATGKPLNSPNANYTYSKYQEVIPGIDDLYFVGSNTKFANEIANEMEKYLSE